MSLFKNKEEKSLSKKVKELEWKIVQLEHDLIHDPLTGLKTREFFREEYGKYVEEINQRHEGIPRKETFGFKNLSVIFFDIDFFKKINDTYGHAMGDKVLQKVSAVLVRKLRNGDIAARWGGEEFVLGLLGADEHDAMIKAESIRTQVEELYIREIPELKISVSAGIAQFEEGASFGEIMKRADQAMYEAKQTGRNRVVSYSSLDTLKAHGN